MKLEQRIFILLLLMINSFSNGSFVTPNGYYNIYRDNKFENFLNLKSNDNKSHDSYYPDVCSNAIKNKDGAKIFVGSSFAIFGFYSNVIVTKDSHMILSDEAIFDNFLNIVCIEGSLIFNTKNIIFMSALVILPGGNFECIDCNIIFRDLFPSSSLIDPFGFFPGVLALGGSLTLVGNQKTVYSATRIDENILEVQDISIPDIFYGYRLNIFSESFPLGKTSTFTYSLNRITVLDLSIPVTDKNIKIFFASQFSTFSTKTTASIHVTGNTNVYIENFCINSFGRTTNDQYNDTQLVFSPDDPNIITGFIPGSNQRFRSSLYIEHSNNVTIKNSAILETRETRSPLVFFGSNVNLSGNIISSSSGSSLIAQYGTENIQSTNNYYSLSLPIIKSLNTTPDSMDYGNEGSGIFSISPKINSIDDTFNGQIIAINHIVLSNRSKITGFDKDCYSPCFNNSVRVSSSIQHPAEFKISGSTFIHSPIYSSGSSSFLFSIISNDKQSTLYKINNSSIEYPIFVKLENSAFILDYIYGFNDFSINGQAKRLDIANSILDPSATSLLNAKDVSRAFSIQNSYMDSKTFQKQNNQIYGSIITPYLYYFQNAMNLIRVSNIFPSVKHQILADTILDMGIELSIISPLFGNLDCEFQFEYGTLTIPFNKTNKNCILPYRFKSEGLFYVRLSLLLSDASENIIYIVDLPMISVFSTYIFYSGWSMIDSNSIKDEISIDGNRFKTGCQQLVLSSNCTISTNSKYVTGLPNVTSSNELNKLFSRGITSIEPYGHVIITIPIDKQSKNNQIQMFFTHQPIDNETSLLSIYVENQPIFLLEPLPSNLGPTFKNLTFHYENLKSLEKINIKFITRGDIYLTSTAIYSSFNQPFNVIGSTKEPNILAIVLPISLSLFAAAAILVGYLTVKKYKKSKNQSVNNLDVEVITSNSRKLRVVKTPLPPLVSSNINNPPSLLISNQEPPNITTPELPYVYETNFLQEPELIDLPTPPKIEPEEPRINFVPLPHFPTVFKKEIKPKLLRNLDSIGPITSHNIESFFEVDVGLPSLRIKNESEIDLPETDYVEEEIEENDDFNNTIEEDGSTNILITKSDGTRRILENHVFVNQFNEISKFDIEYFDFKDNVAETPLESFEIPPLEPGEIKKHYKIQITDFLLSPELNKRPLQIYLNSFRNRNDKLRYGKYGSNENSILVIETSSYYYDCADQRLPISIPRNYLDFGFKDGNKCIVGKTYNETLRFVNIYDERYNVYSLFPENDDNILIKTSVSSRPIGPHSFFEVDINVTLKTTTKFYEKVAIRYETADKTAAWSTFVYLNLESQVSSKIDFNELVLKKYLSEGTFGVVYSGLWRSSLVAVKLFKHHYSYEEIERETSILSKLRHPNIVSFIGSLNFSNTCGVVVDYHPMGPLNKYIHNNNVVLSMVQKIRLSLDIAKACSYLHKNGIIHRDLKPENVLIVSLNPESSICAKVSDFGTSKETNGKYNFNSKVGTTRYMSPEALAGLSYTYSTDVYSFAILFFELLSGRLPFREIPKKDIAGFVHLGTRPRLDQDVFTDNDISLILLTCWNPNPCCRPTFDTLIDILENLLKKYKASPKRNLNSNIQ
ncbi:hypothetical protein RB653_007138 [Dictyostelium firmibasis]|uniref:Protein kinase domain-containing protein n=1 Tax=Dictyostelium firmibasis TaxID=79012 RepID=A0AAN7TLA4_9MYCE